MPTNSPLPRVALVAASLDILGGQGVEAHVLAEALRREDGCDVMFVPINPRLPRGLERLRRVKFARTIANQLWYVPSLAQLARADVVHVFSASYWSFLISPLPAMLAGRAMGKRVVLHYHSGEADDHLANWGALVHPWLRLADQIVVPSQYLRGVFARYGYRTRVIPNVIDFSRFRYRERQPPAPRLLSVRNLERYYRVDVTIEAFAAIRRRFPGATLTIAGVGSEESRLRELAAALDLRDVRFVGRVEPDAMPELYRQHDVFLNSSVVDNQPVSILEAFAAGLLVVSTPTGDIPSMVRHGETGWLVPTGDASAMADAVKDLLDDPSQAIEVARRARQEVSGYTWPMVRQSWFDVYAGSMSDVSIGEHANDGAL